VQVEHTGQQFGARGTQADAGQMDNKEMGQVGADEERLSLDPHTSTLTDKKT